VWNPFISVRVEVALGVLGLCGIHESYCGLKFDLGCLVVWNLWILVHVEVAFGVLGLCGFHGS